MGMTIPIGKDAGGHLKRVSQSGNTVMLILPPGLNMALWPQSRLRSSLRSSK